MVSVVDGCSARCTLHATSVKYTVVFMKQTLSNTTAGLFVVIGD